MNIDRIRLGKSDIFVPPVMLGVEALAGYDWGKMDVGKVERATEYAIDRGLTFFDVADCYGLGSVEEKLGSIAGPERDNVTIGTKFGVRVENGKTRYDNSPDYIRWAVNESLRRMNTDYIDLYQLHWPDGETALDDVVATLEDLCDAGKIRTYGLCNVDDEQWMAGQKSDRLVTYSLEYSLANRKNQSIIERLAKLNHLTLLSWGTMGQGILSGKYTAESTFDPTDRRSKPHWQNFHGENLERNLKTVDVMREIAGQNRNFSNDIAAIAVRWCMDSVSHCIPVVGIKTETQVQSVLNALAQPLGADALDWLNKVSDVGQLE